LTNRLIDRALQSLTNRGCCSIACYSATAATLSLMMLTAILALLQVHYVILQI